MKKEIRMVSLAVGWVLGVGVNLAVAMPRPNQQGDYPLPSARQRGIRQLNWQVVDKDPKGVNCRMARQFQSVQVDGADAPRELFENRYNISGWDVVTTLQRGDRVQAVTGNRANQIMFADNRGKPWLPVSTPRGNCFVRANSRFIKPIRENPDTLEPQE